EGTGTRTRLTATGAGPGGGPHVKVYDAATGQLKFSFFAFDPNFTGGVRVAVGDVNGDGVDDIVCAAGPGGGPAVKVFDGTDGHLLTSFFAYDPGFSGGVTVAAGDITGSGKADIVTGADAGGGPHVKVFDGTTGAVLDQFMAYDIGFTGGVRVACGDVNGDGLMDIVTGAGPGGGPHVQVFDEEPLLVHPVYYYPNGPTRAQLSSVFAFDQSYTGGVFVAAGDVTGDGKAELVVGQGQGIGAKVRVLNAIDGSVLAESAPFAGSFVLGARVAVTDPNEHGRAEVLAAPGPVGTKVKILDGATLAQQSEFTAYDPNFPGGVFVG
ncbi:MAG: FG-GAP-like repeat-containing protein, partial [Gemmataceae bacterium]